MAANDILASFENVASLQEDSASVINIWQIIKTIQGSLQFRLAHIACTDILQGSAYKLPLIVNFKFTTFLFSSALASNEFF